MKGTETGPRNCTYLYQLVVGILGISRDNDFNKTTPQINLPSIEKVAPVLKSCMLAVHYLMYLWSHLKLSKPLTFTKESNKCSFVGLVNSLVFMLDKKRLHLKLGSDNPRYLYSIHANL